MKRLIIAEAARQDLSDIANYTVTNRGVAQKQAYLGAIREKLIALCGNPSVGITRNDIAPGYRSLSSGRHRIFYRATEDEIFILRILHDRMDVHRHVGGEDTAD